MWSSSINFYFLPCTVSAIAIYYFCKNMRRGINIALEKFEASLMWEETLSITQWNCHLSPRKISSGLCLHFQSFLTYSSKKEKKKRNRKKVSICPNWGPQTKIWDFSKKTKKQEYGTGVVLSRAYLLKKGLLSITLRKLLGILRVL